jgi:ferredoxin
MAITKVWIEEGCIVCNACEAECPDVFHVTDTSCNINGSVRKDGVDNENRDEMSELNDDLQTAQEAAIEAAAAACPVEVIKFEKA